MSKHLKYIFLTLFSAFFLFGLTGQARAATYCFCFDDLNLISLTNYKTAGEDFKSSELTYCQTAVPTCTVEVIKKNTSKGPAVFSGGCTEFEISKQNDCVAANDEWQGQLKAKIKAGPDLEKTTSGLVGAILPECVVNPNQTCDDVGIFVIAGINLISFLFGIIGALALVMFVYGGFVLILSQGSPEKVKQGTGVMIAAVVGLIIAFGGYLLVKFIGTVVDVKNTFNLL